jgi:hypothetical protein
MITDTTRTLAHTKYLIRPLVWTLLLVTMLYAVGCGSDSQQTSNTAKYPAGISEDIEQQLKYDARVESFEPDGQNLVVNVNNTWLHAPTGMRERTLGQWYSLWQTGHGNASKVVVKHDGEEVESWTADKGYQPATMEKKDASEG